MINASLKELSAALAQKKISAVELATLFLDRIEQLQSVDTTGIEPMAHAVDVVQRLRPDAVTEPDRREAYQAVAPEIEAGLYLVPRVVE